MAQYISQCGIKFDAPSKAKTRRVYIERKVINGIGLAEREFDISDKCRNCPAKKHKSKGEFYNPETDSLYITQEQYCVAERV